MTQRLQKILSERGVASRRTSEALISAGRVMVNGRVAALGDSADPEIDEILLDGQPLPDRQKAVYIMLHKPRGFVTTLSDEKGRRTVAELVSDCGYSSTGQVYHHLKPLIAADMFGKVKTVVQMVAIIMVMAFEGFMDIFACYLPSLCFLNTPLEIVYNVALWISAVLTVISGVNYWWKNRSCMDFSKL